MYFSKRALHQFKIFPKFLDACCSIKSPHATQSEATHLSEPVAARAAWLLCLAFPFLVVAVVYAGLLLHLSKGQIMTATQDSCHFAKRTTIEGTTHAATASLPCLSLPRLASTIHQNPKLPSSLAIQLQSSVLSRLSYVWGILFYI